jgi:hypothetical protein
VSVRRPSLGFCLMVLTYSLSLAFFVWGLGTPPLDRVWQMHHELKTGRLYALAPQDRELLASALNRHPALSEALLPAGQVGMISANRGGWIETPIVSIIRTPRAQPNQRLVLDVQTPPQHLPYRLLLEGPGWRQERQVQARGVLSLDLPPPPTQPELLTLKLEGKGLRADSSSLGVRVTFDPPEASAASDDDDEQAEAAAE